MNYQKDINNMKSLEWIQQWFATQCNNDWEHQFGIAIETLDNPGWKLIVDLESIILENAPFKPVSIERSANAWIFCQIKEKKFEGFCGTENLVEVISIFREWSENVLYASSYNRSCE